MFLEKCVCNLPINSCFTRTTSSTTISYKSIFNWTQNPVLALPISTHYYGEAIGRVYNNMNVKWDCSHSNSNKLCCPHGCPNNDGYTMCSPCWTFLIAHGFEQKHWMGGILIAPKANTDPLFLLSSYEFNDCHLLWRKYYEYLLLVARVHNHTISLLIYCLS